LRGVIEAREVTMSEVEVYPGPFFVTLSPITDNLQDASIDKLFFLIRNLILYKMSQDYKHGVGNDFIRMSKLEVQSIEYIESGAKLNMKGLAFVFQGESSDGLPSETELRGIIRDIITGQSFMGTVKLSGNSQLATINSVDFGFPTTPSPTLPPTPSSIDATSTPTKSPESFPTPSPTPLLSSNTIVSTNAPTRTTVTETSSTTSAPTQIEVTAVAPTQTTSITASPTIIEVAVTEVNEEVTEIGGKSNQLPVIASASAVGVFAFVALFILLLKRQRKKMTRLEDFEEYYDEEEGAEFEKMNKAKQSPSKAKEIGHARELDMNVFVNEKDGLQYDHSPSKSQNCSPVRMPRRSGNPYVNMDSDDRNYVLHKDMLLSSNDPKQSSSYAVLYGSNPGNPGTPSTTASTPTKTPGKSALQQSHFQSGDIASVPSSNESVSMDSIQFEPDQEWNPDDDIIDYEDQDTQMYVEKPSSPKSLKKKSHKLTQQDSFTHIQVKNENLIL